MASKFLFASFIGLVLAQTTVITISVPKPVNTTTMSGRTITQSAMKPTDLDDFFASVIGVSSDATTYEVKCQPKSRASSTMLDYCADAIGTLIYGPSTFDFNQSFSGSLVFTENCSLSSFYGTCTASFDSVGPTSTSAEINTESVGPNSFMALPLTITAGADKLNQTGTATPTSGSASQTPGASQTRSTPSRTSNAAAATAVMLGGTLLGAAAGVFGGLL